MLVCCVFLFILFLFCAGLKITELIQKNQLWHFNFRRLTIAQSCLFPTQYMQTNKPRQNQNQSNLKPNPTQQIQHNTFLQHFPFSNIHHHLHRFSLSGSDLRSPPHRETSFQTQNPDPYFNKQTNMIAIPYLTALTTYFSYGLLFAFGQFRDFFRKIFDWCSANTLQVPRRFYILHLIL